MALSPEEITAIGRACADAMDARCHAILKNEFELVLGIDCTDEEVRAEVRKDMEWLRESRTGISLKDAEDDHIFVRRFRNAISKAVWRVGYAVIMAALAGLMWLAGVGWKPELLK